MYKKILWYARNHPENFLPYHVLVAAIFAEKEDPATWFEFTEKEFNLKKFCEDCSKPNVFFEREDKLNEAFKAKTGFSTDDFISSEIWQEIIGMDSVYDYIEKKTFNSQLEIKKLCEKIYSEYLNETAFNDQKKVMAIYGRRGTALSTQMWNLCKNIDAKEKWTDSTANLYWFGSNAIRCITEKLVKLMDVEQTHELYVKASLNLIECFGFSSLQIEMLRYFICQSRDGDCPEQLNKAIYIWGDKKKVGKTTIASTLVSILNGEKNISNIKLYKSNMGQELGWETHTAPMICSCRAVLMDEAMPKDSSKSYGTFKDRITSFGVRIRFVFKNQIIVDARPNYVFTSNDPLEYFIQDKTERRFFEFHLEERQNNLTYEKIYEVFLKFVQQCKREKEWMEWSDELAGDTEVRGIESRNIEDVQSILEMDGFEPFVTNFGSQVSIGAFVEWVHKYDREVTKKIINETVLKMFGEPVKPSTWKRIKIFEVLNKIKNDEQEAELKSTGKKINDAEDVELKFNDDCPY